MVKKMFVSVSQEICLHVFYVYQKSYVANRNYHFTSNFINLNLILLHHYFISQVLPFLRLNSMEVQR